MINSHMVAARNCKQIIDEPYRMIKIWSWIQMSQIEVLITLIQYDQYQNIMIAPFQKFTVQWMPKKNKKVYEIESLSFSPDWS